MNKVQGNCFCKAVQFEIQFPTEFASHCHCESCRTSHGSAFVTWGGVARKQFRFISGENNINRYESTPGVKWSFCRNCGTNLLYDHDGAPEKTYFTVANLTGPLDRNPDSHVSFEEKASWLHIADELPKYRAKTEERILPMAITKIYRYNIKAGTEAAYINMQEQAQILYREHAEVDFTYLKDSQNPLLRTEVIKFFNSDAIETIKKIDSDPRVLQLFEIFTKEIWDDSISIQEEVLTEEPMLNSGRTRG